MTSSPPASSRAGWRTAGHPGAVQLLSRSLDAGRLAHAYLVSGPRQSGKMCLAMDLARAVNCEAVEDMFGERPSPPCGVCRQCDRIQRGLHADVSVIAVEQAPARRAGEGDDAGSTRTRISIDQIRVLQRDAALKPFEGRFRVFIIDGAELMTDEAANCLLKTLEEPAEGVLLVLLASPGRAIPATIVSRCQGIDLRPVPRDVIQEMLVERHGADEETADALSRLAHARPGWAIAALEDPTALDRHTQGLFRILGALTSTLEPRFRYAADVSRGFRRDRETVYKELDLWLEWLRDVLLVSQGAPGGVTNASWIPTLEGIAGELNAEAVIGAIRSVASTRSALEANASPQVALEVMMLDMPWVKPAAVPAGVLPVEEPV